MRIRGWRSRSYSGRRSRDTTRTERTEENDDDTEDGDPLHELGCTGCLHDIHAQVQHLRSVSRDLHVMMLAGVAIVIWHVSMNQLMIMSCVDTNRLVLLSPEVCMHVADRPEYETQAQHHAQDLEGSRHRGQCKRPRSGLSFFLAYGGRPAFSADPCAIAPSAPGLSGSAPSTLHRTVAHVAHTT